MKISFKTPPSINVKQKQKKQKNKTKPVKMEQHLTWILLLALVRLSTSSHFRFGTISWSTITETYPCADGVSGPAAVDTPCHFPFRHGNRAHAACTGHNKTVTATMTCEDTCSYPKDGDCDDGGKNSKYSFCDLGTDCTDCGSRSIAGGDGFYAGPTGWCATSASFDSTQHWGGCKMCTATKKIRLKVHLAYRRSGVGGTKWIRNGDNNKVGDMYSAGLYIYWGDGTRTMPNPMQVTSGGLSETWADSLGEFTHDYSSSFLQRKKLSGDGGFSVKIRSCCRIGELKNNANAYFQLSTFVKVNAFESGGSGPESSQVPMVQIPQSSLAQQFDVSGYSESAGGTAANGNLRFQWSSGMEMGVGNLNIKKKRYNGDRLGMALNEETGALSWVTANIALGLYSASVKVLDTTTSSYTLVDFIVNVVPPPPKFCSFACMKAGGITCKDNDDCNLDACSAVLETGVVSSSAIVSYGGTWFDHSSGELRYKRALPRVVVTTASGTSSCLDSKKYCTSYLSGQRRGSSLGSQGRLSESACVRASHCWDSVSRVCHAAACLDDAATERVALFSAPPMGSHFGGGQYKVFVRFPTAKAEERRMLSTKVKIQVRHATGTSTLELDSSMMADASWHELGSYMFDSAVNLALHQPSTQSSVENGADSTRSLLKSQL